MERFSGVLAPVITPFKKDLTPDKERLIAHSRWILSKGVNLAVFGTNSEANSLSVNEKIDLFQEMISNKHMSVQIYVFVYFIEDFEPIV